MFLLLLFLMCSAHGNAQQRCPPNQHFEECASACPLTCDNYQNPPRVCTMQCVIGCQCDEGFLWTDNRQCVRAEDCPPTPEVCGNNEVYLECGSACPLNCDNYRRRPNCQQTCVRGCHCRRGFVRGYDNRCIRPFNCRANETSCTDIADSGHCLGFFPSWYYDEQSGRCQAFIYGGCGGNGNRFNTLAECQQRCAGIRERRSALCRPMPETGPCRAFFTRYFYNISLGECDTFVYGGCQGNSNNFRTLQECINICRSN